MSRSETLDPVISFVGNENVTIGTDGNVSDTSKLTGAETWRPPPSLKSVPSAGWHPSKYLRRCGEIDRAIVCNGHR